MMEFVIFTPVQSTTTSAFVVIFDPIFTVCIPATLGGARVPPRACAYTRWGLWPGRKVSRESVGHMGHNALVGAPTKLTDELRFRVEQELAQGVPVEASARARLSSNRRARARLRPPAPPYAQRLDRCRVKC
jgi:hypothetical protein